MTFIIVLIALLMERFFHWHHLRHWAWFRNYERWLSVRIGNWPSILFLLCNAVPPLVVVGLINYILSGILYDIPQFIFGVIVVLYCLGPENLWVQTYRCISLLHHEDPQQAVEQLHSAFGVPHPEHSQAFHQKFVHAIFLAAHQRIFAVLFWFVILGPVGAVLYRMMNNYRAQSVHHLQSLAMKVQNYMDWISIRLFTFLFALGGHFTKLFAYWRPGFFKGPQKNDELLTNCGMAALDVMQGELLPESGQAEREAIALLDRVFAISLVILAVIVLLV